jgi:hypothetical protein
LDSSVQTYYWEIEVMERNTTNGWNNETSVIAMTTAGTQVSSSTPSIAYY